MNYIGIDLGGTNIAVGIVDKTGRILAETFEPTPVGQPCEEYITRMTTCIDRLLNTTRLRLEDMEAIGVGIPGIVIESLGLVAQCTNLAWYNVPFLSLLRSAFPVPVRMGNDADLAALAEHMVGAGAGCNSSVLITLGTGVGGGIIINGQPWSGAFGQAGEIGHSILVADGIPCHCGRNGCMEQYCSATALIRNARQICEAFPQNAMVRMAGGNLDNLTAKIVIDAARDGDPWALRVFNRYTHYLALAVDSVINIINPEIILIGGGISQAGSFLLDAVRAQVPSHEKGVSRPISRIELAALRNDAGIIGAAMLAKQH